LCCFNQQVTQKWRSGFADPAPALLVVTGELSRLESNVGRDLAGVWESADRRQGMNQSQTGEDSDSWVAAKTLDQLVLLGKAREFLVNAPDFCGKQIDQG
jgi:hypothetical protein